MEHKTFEERYRDEVLTDNASLNHFAQCKDCIFRWKTYFDFNGDRYPCDDAYGWEKGSCQIFKYPQDKPDEVYNNTGQCEYYEKEKQHRK